LQGWAAKLLLLWVGIFHFFSFQICNHVTAVSFFRLAYNGWRYEIVGDYGALHYQDTTNFDVRDAVNTTT
jgi:hypothetical protein